ncbi:MAG: hypothetical protein HN704_14755 [Bacteroidetes bacterium]|jgi:hypothetical protein|nr:hypothetical protein [Bacteroidota bacterium]MBT7492858.1 hypothetical protein [Bacteroidota bacterium]
MNLTLSINATAFKHIFTKVKNKKGDMIDAIVIPLDPNYLQKTKKGNLYMNFWVNAMKEPFKNDDGKVSATHSIKQKFSKEIAEGMTKEEKKEQPYFGNANIFGGGDSEPEPNTAEIEISNEEGSDDLPF